MRLSVKQLIGLPVETENGTTLGTVVDFAYDPFSQRIMTYAVKAHLHLPALIGNDELIVGGEQVVSVTTEKMIVVDLLVKDEAKSERPVAA